MAGAEQVPAILQELQALRAQLTATAQELADERRINAQRAANDQFVQVMASIPIALQSMTEATRTLADRNKPSMLEIA